MLDGGAGPWLELEDCWPLPWWWVGDGGPSTSPLPSIGNRLTANCDLPGGGCGAASKNPPVNPVGVAAVYREREDEAEFERTRDDDDAAAAACVTPRGRTVYSRFCSVVDADIVLGADADGKGRW